MTSRNCLFNFKLFVRSLLQQKYLMIIHTVLLILATAVPAILEYSDEGSCSCCTNFDLKFENIFNLLSMKFVFPVILVVSFISVYIGFSHLYKRQSAVLFGAMPIKKSAIYTTRLCACIISVITPVIVVAVINLAAFNLMDFENWNEACYFDYTDLTVYGNGLLLKTIACVLLQYILYTAIFVFSATVSGNGFAQFITAGFVCLVYPVTSVIIAMYVNLFETWQTYLNIDYRYIFPFLANTFEAKHCIFTVLLAGIALLAGVVLYVKRKNEKSGEFYSFGWVKEFIKYYIAFGSAFVFCYFVNQFNKSVSVIPLITGSVLSIITFVVLRGIFEKSFKAMFAKPKHLIIFALIMIFVLLTVLFDVLGFDSRVGNLKKAKIDVTDFDCNIDYEISLDSSDCLEIVERMIETGLKYREDNDGPDGSRFVYIGISESPVFIHRKICLPSGMYSDFITELYGTDGYREQLIEYIGTWVGAELSIHYNGNIRNVDSENSELVEALISDISSCNLKEGRKNGDVYKIEFDTRDERGGCAIPVYGNFEKTIALITETVPEFKIDK